MRNDFSFDAERFKRFEGTLPPPRSPEETFNLKSGIYVDAAVFAKETLNRIDPSYQAQIVVLFIGRGANYYVCSLKKDGKIFMMDYGTPYKTMIAPLTLLIWPHVLDRIHIDHPSVNGEPLPASDY
jgi:hypothetical protein